MIVPQTGAANNFCVKNVGGYPGMFTALWDGIRQALPSQFAIEAAFKPETGRWRTIVGRDRLYNGAHSDRAYGYVDEVRISHSALSVAQFLMAGTGPTPTAATLINPIRMPAGGLQFTLSNLAVGTTYVIQAATNPGSWSGIATDVAASAVECYTDSSATTFGRRFCHSWHLP